jgi:hypothetical protein
MRLFTEKHSESRVDTGNTDKNGVEYGCARDSWNPSFPANFVHISGQLSSTDKSSRILSIHYR